MNTLKLNSAGLNRVTLNTIGEVRFKSRGGEPKPPSYENGVYIQHIDGKLYTTDEWTAKAFANAYANGVAVIDEACSFVVAKQDISSVKVWHTRQYATLEGLPFLSTAAEASVDFDGVNNTAIMFPSDKIGASLACVNYTFPNGIIGYLPAAGEMLIAYSHKDAINAALSILGAPSMFERHQGFWTSTQQGAMRAWVLSAYEGRIIDEGKHANCYVRPFAPLNI